MQLKSHIKLAVLVILMSMGLVCNENMPKAEPLANSSMSLKLLESEFNIDLSQLTHTYSSLDSHDSLIEPCPYSGTWEVGSW